MNQPDDHTELPPPTIEERLRAAAAQQRTPTSSRRRWPFIAAAVLVIIGATALGIGLTAGGGGDKTAAVTPTTIHLTTPVSADPLQAAFEACSGAKTISLYWQSHDQADFKDVEGAGQVMGASEKDMATQMLVDTWDGAEHTISIDGAWADDNSGKTQAAVLYGIYSDCLQRELPVPTRVRDHIGHTRALDGTQTDTWDGISARWTYHPDDGLSITFWEA